MLPAHIEDEIQVTPVSMKIKTKWSQVKKQMLPSERENSEKDVNQAAADDVHPAFRNPYLPLPAASTAPEVVTTAGLVTTTFSTDDATAGDSDSTGAENIELEGGTIIKTESLTTAIDDAAADGEAVDEAADEAALKAWRAQCEQILNEDDGASEHHSEDANCDADNDDSADEAADNDETADEAADEAALKAWKAQCEQMLTEDDGASEDHSEDAYCDVQEDEGDASVRDGKEAVVEDTTIVDDTIPTESVVENDTDEAANDDETADEAADEAALKAWRAHCEEMLDEDDDASELHSEDFESPRLHCEEISNDDDDHSEDFELPPLNPMVRKELELLGVDLSEAGLARHVKLAVDKAWASLSTG